MLHLITVLIMSSVAVLGAVEQLRGHIVVPASGVLAPPERSSPIVVDGVDVQVRLRDRHARTTMDVVVRNSGSRREEASILLPIPGGAAVSGLDFAGAAGEPSARLLPIEEARALYRSIVAQVRDPALMEFVGRDLIRSSVFPVEPHSTQTLRIVWESLLPRQEKVVELLLPRSERLSGGIPWTIELDLAHRDGIAGVYSPSHPLTVRQTDEGFRASGRLTAPGSFIAQVLLAQEGPGISAVAYPDAGGGGYFALVAAAPPAQAEDRALPRELTLVLDRSGSMRGDKLAQVREAAKQLLAGLAPDERFNIIAYSHGVERFAAEPVPKTAENEARARAGLDALTPRGGTNIEDALLAALRQPAPDAHLPMLVFCTDGVPTVATTNEALLRERAAAANAHARRIFTIGVGSDLNAHLLEKLAMDSRATTTLIAPGADIEVACARLGEQLRGPVFADVELSVLSADGEGALPGRVLDRAPSSIADLFAGGELLIFGRYTSGEAMRLRLDGRGVGGERHLTVTLDPDRARVENAWVARLWATRKIATLIDAIRELGADGSVVRPDDPRLRELVDEVVRLSQEFGVLTEYTAFFAREGSLDAAVADAVARSVQESAMQRAGSGSFAASDNNQARLNAKTLQPRSSWALADGERMEADAAVEQQGATSWFQNSHGWVEGKLIDAGAMPEPQRVITVGSEAYFELAERLAASNKQAALARHGTVLLEVDDEVIEVRP